MKIKKVFIILTLTMVFLLTGCAKKASFNGKLGFTEQLSQKEKIVVVSKVRQEFENLTEYSANYYRKTYSEEEEQEVNNSQKVTIYSDYHIHMVSDINESDTEDKLTITNKEKRTIDIFDNRSSNVLVHYMESNKDEINYWFNKYENDDIKDIESSFYSDNVYDEFITELNNMNAYKDGKNYVFVSQNVNKNVQGVAWGDSTKEQVVTNRNQTIIKVSSKYRITSYSSMQERFSNRDEDTGAWYKKEKQVLYSSTIINFKYGSRKAGTSISSKLVSKLSGRIFDDVTFKLGLGEMTYYPSTEIKSESVTKMHLIATYKPTVLEAGKEYTFAPTLSIKYRDNFTEGNTESQISFTVLGGSRNVLETTSNTLKVKYQEGITFVFEMDVVIKNGNIQVENATACVIE